MSAACAVSRKAQPPLQPRGEKDPPAKAMRRAPRQGPGAEEEGAAPPGGGSNGEAPFCGEQRRQQEPRAPGAKLEAEEERLEREHFRRIINAFRYYGTNMHERVNRTERQFRSLPANQQNLLPQFLLHLDKIRTCIDHNQEILQTIVNDCPHMFENREYKEDARRYRKTTAISIMDDVQGVLGMTDFQNGSGGNFYSFIFAAKAHVERAKIC